MPLRNCKIDKNPGYAWGKQGKCYAYDPSSEESKTEAKKKAIAQGVAIGDLEALAVQVGLIRGTYALSVDEKLESYTDYPESARNAARRALEWADKNGWGECGTPVGKARASQLANGEPISRETIARMAAFARHLQNKDVPYSEGCGGLMVDAWGGQAGIEWAQRKLKEIDSEKLAVQIVGMDFDGTLSTRAGQQLWNRLGGDFVITARSLFNLDEVYSVTDRLGIPRDRVIWTGSNSAKVAEVKRRGITEFYDNNSDVVRQLPGIGKLFRP